MVHLGHLVKKYSYPLFKLFTTCIPRNMWQKPEGYDTGIKVYNSMVREKVPLILRNKDVATWYMCGPTVYADAHIGHASCYVKFDIIRRILERIFKIDVVMAMGITDIDDKIIDRAKTQGCTIHELSRKYELEFFEDLESLNIQHPSVTCRVTDFIPQILSFCETLIKKNFAYVTSEGNVYFIVSTADSEETIENTEYRRVIDRLKRDSRDFALWKAAKQGEPYWASPWGNGRPGWHIECSTMASFIFGDKLDIHTGGADLKFPHHTNEISQSEAYHDCTQWVNYWFHSGLMNVAEDVKMSKSLGNVITIRDFLKEHSANVFRIMCLQSPYSSHMQFCSESLQLAQGVYSKFHVFLNDAEAYVRGEVQCQPFDSADLMKKLYESKDRVRNLLADDFNTYAALNCMINLVGEANCFLQVATDVPNTSMVKVISALSSFMDDTLETFGVNVLSKRKLPRTFVCSIDVVVRLRSEIRNFALWGTISEEVVKHYCLEDKKYSNGNFNGDIILKIIDNTQRELTAMRAVYDRSVSDSFPCQCIFNCSHYMSLLSNAISHFRKIMQAHVISCKAAEQVNDNLSLTQNQLLKLQEARKVPFLKACDDFRTTLNSYGIAVRDFKDNSIWYPNIEIQTDAQPEASK